MVCFVSISVFRSVRLHTLLLSLPSGSLGFTSLELIADILVAVLLGPNFLFKKIGILSFVTIICRLG